jgi:hypothetical protein
MIKNIDIININFICKCMPIYLSLFIQHYQDHYADHR